MRTDDVLAQIDSALHDWTVSADAMRSKPADEPPVPAALARPVPLPSDVRGMLARRISDRHDLPQESALQAVRDAERGISTDHTDLVKAEAQTLISESVDRIRVALRPVLSNLAAALQHLRAAVPCDDRPGPARRDRRAWQSPYGPPPRRR